MIEYESTLERDLLRKFAFNRRVMRVESQPMTIEWRDSLGHAQHYTPDILVHWRWMGEFWRNRDVPWLIEVKPLADLKKHWCKWHPKFRMASRFAAQRGWRFRILDEARIRDLVFHNAVLLERYAWPSDPVEDDAVANAVVEDIRRAGVCTITGVLRRHSGPGGPLRAQSLWRMIGMGLIDCDLTRPLGMSTEVWIPANDY